MAYYKYKGHDIFYEEFGRGTPLLLLHGNTASSVMFGDIAEIYSKNHFVILMDFLGCGKSDRVEMLDEDLWYDEAMQAICLLESRGYSEVDIIGTSGGALAALNVGLERPDLVGRIIADSFEGERADPRVTDGLRAQREMSMKDPGAAQFYEMMNGPDWEQAVRADTDAVIAHAENTGDFFHKPLSELKRNFLLTGSMEDEFMPEGYLENVYPEILVKAGHGAMHIFKHGGHPAMLSNMEKFVQASELFLQDK